MTAAEWLDVCCVALIQLTLGATIFVVVLLRSVVDGLQ